MLIGSIKTRTATTTLAAVLGLTSSPLIVFAQPPTPDAPAPESPATSSEPAPSPPAAEVAPPLPPAPAPAPVAAEPESGIESIDDVNLEELLNYTVVSTSKKAEKLSDAPATVYVITGKDIHDRGYVNLTDVLRDLPGIDPSFNYFSEMGSLISVRGQSGNNKIIVLINGTRVNPPGGEDMMFRSDFSVRHAKQIEVSYGPGSTLYGEDAIFGVINVITIEPGTGTHGAVQGAYGSQQYKDGFASLSSSLGAGDKTKISAFVQWIDSDLGNLSETHKGWWDTHYGAAGALGGTPPKRWDRGLNAFARVQNEGSSLQAWFRRSSRSSAEGAYGGILYMVDEAKWADQSLIVEAANQARLHETLTLNSSLTYNRYETDSNTRYVFPVKDALFLDDFKYAKGEGVSVEERLAIEPMKGLSFMAGGIASFMDVNPKATIPSGANTNADIVSQGGAFTYYGEAGNPMSLVSVPRATNLNYKNFGAYLEGHYQMLKSLRLVVGARLDKNTRYDEVPVSPRAAVIFRPLDRVTLKYIVTRAFVAPSPYSGNNVYDNGSALNIRNTKLEPERALSNELNATYTGDRILGGFSAYLTSAENLISYADRGLPENIVQAQVFLDMAGTQTRQLTHTANGGKTQSLGFDLYSRANFKIASVWSSVSYVDTKSTLAGRELGLDQLSHVNVRLGSTFTFLPGLTFTPSLVLRSNLSFTDEAAQIAQSKGWGDEVKLPYELNAHLAYELQKGLTLFATGRNVSNHAFATKGVLTAAAQERVRVYGGVRYEY